MNSSWKVFRALSAASQTGMSLWRMYSAREQDQPPSVLLVGTFYKNQQEPGRGQRATRRAHQPRRNGKPPLPSPRQQRSPCRMCFAPRTMKFHLAPLWPFVTHHVTQTYKLPVAAFFPPYTSHLRSPKRRELSRCLNRAVSFRLQKRNQPTPSDSSRAERSVLL